MRWCNGLNPSLLTSVIEAIASVVRTIIGGSQRPEFLVLGCRPLGAVGLPGIVQLCGHVGSHSLLGFDRALFESDVVLVRSNGWIICLILEHLDLRRSTLLSPLSSLYLVGSALGVYVVCIKNLFALLIEELLKVFVLLIQIETFLHFMEVKCRFGHCWGSAHNLIQPWWLFLGLIVAKYFLDLRIWYMIVV